MAARPTRSTSLAVHAAGPLQTPSTAEEPQPRTLLDFPDEIILKILRHLLPTGHAVPEAKGGRPERRAEGINISTQFSRLGRAIPPFKILTGAPHVVTLARLRHQISRELHRGSVGYAVEPRCIRLMDMSKAGAPALLDDDDLAGLIGRSDPKAEPRRPWRTIRVYMKECDPALNVRLVCKRLKALMDAEAKASQASPGGAASVLCSPPLMASGLMSAAVKGMLTPALTLSDAFQPKPLTGRITENWTARFFDSRDACRLMNFIFGALRIASNHAGVPENASMTETEYDVTLTRDTASQRMGGSVPLKRFMSFSVTVECSYFAVTDGKIAKRRLRRQWIGPFVPLSVWNGLTSRSRAWNRSRPPSDAEGNPSKRRKKGFCTCKPTEVHGAALSDEAQALLDANNTKPEATQKLAALGPLSAWQARWLACVMKVRTAAAQFPGG